MAYVPVKVRLQRQLLDMLTILKEQDGEPMQFNVLAAKVGFSIIQTAELMDLWQSSEKIGFDMATKSIWYKHDLRIRGKEDIVRHLQSTIHVGATDVKELKETYPPAVEAILELEKAGEVLVIRGKDGNPRLVYYNSLNLKKPEDGDETPRYPSSAEFQPYWKKVVVPQDSDILVELGAAGLTTAETGPKITATARPQAKKKAGRRIKITNTHLDPDIDLTKDWAGGGGGLMKK
ncbi:hypothetical protein DFJ73DRAFT_874688 [Zopfochytrium polystomum]|nr:hypothetical protein DFJ73DRAFT_874688 [Zopfochytrium polystomum]